MLYNGFLLTSLVYSYLLMWSFDSTNDRPYMALNKFEEMGQKLTPVQAKFYNRIDEILWEDWDPIEVNDYESARDEYQSYFPQIFRFVLGNAEASEIADYLNYVATESIGLQSNLDHCTEIAKLIKSAHAEIYQQSAL